MIRPTHTIAPATANRRTWGLFLILAALAVLAALVSTGCKTLTPGNSLQLNQRWQALEAADGDMSKLLGELKSTTTSREPMIGEDGRPILGPDGNVLYRTTEVAIERGLPSAPASIDLYGDSEFIKSKLGFSIDNNGDGSSVHLNQTTEIDTPAYKAGVTEQTRQIDSYLRAATDIAATAASVGAGAILADKDKSIAKDGNDLVATMAERGFAPDGKGGFVFVPESRPPEHVEEPVAPPATE